jgi:Uncharacterized protein conserved in bacteria (DUF2169)
VGLGCYPLDGGLRPAHALAEPLARAMETYRAAAASGAPPELGPPNPADVRPTLFNHAHPDMIIEAEKAPRAGDWVSVSHGLPGGGELGFALPDAPRHAHVQLEDRHYAFPFHLDQIGIVCGEGRVLLGYRSVFEYRLVKGERRFCVIRRGPPPLEVPPEHHQPLGSHFRG